MKIILPMRLSGLEQSHPMELPIFDFQLHNRTVGEGNVRVTIINGALPVNIQYIISEKYGTHNACGKYTTCT